MSGPDFICIGAARSGTTWISANLGLSDEIWVPRRKELHYFTRSEKYPSPSFLLETNPLRNISGSKQGNRRFRREVVRTLGHDLMHPNFKQLKWDLHYLFGAHTNAWYQELFAGQPDKITGELTPAYALLDDMAVAEMVATLPDTKFIYIVRNPIDRAWSTICYHEKRGHAGLTDQSEDKIEAYLSQPGIMSRSDYLSVYQRWQKIAGESQVLLAFYDEIVASPGDLLRRILDFVGVKDIEGPISRMTNKRVNASKEKQLPDNTRKFLNAQYHNGIEAFSNEVGGFATKWLQSL